MMDAMFISDLIGFHIKFHVLITHSLLKSHFTHNSFSDL